MPKSAYLTLDELIEAAHTARGESPIGGKTVVYLSEPEVEYIPIVRPYLDRDTDGAVFLLHTRPQGILPTANLATAHGLLLEALGALVENGKIEPGTTESGKLRRVLAMLKPDDEPTKSDMARAHAEQHGIPVVDIGLTDFVDALDMRGLPNRKSPTAALAHLGEALLARFSPEEMKYKSHRFVLIEMSDVELLGVHLFASEQLARETFNRMCEENGITESDDLAANETAGTIALAGDDAYSVQLLRKDTLTALPPVIDRTDPAT